MRRKVHPRSIWNENVLILARSENRLRDLVLII